MSAGADTGPDDWLPAAPAPSAAPTPSGPDDWTPAAPSAASPADDDGSAAKAFGYGVLQGIPFAPQIAAAGNAGVTALSHKLDDWGLLNADQKKSLASMPDSYAAARDALATKGGQAAEEHPYYNLAGQALPMGFAPGAGTVKGAAIYGGALGAGQGDSVADSAARAATGAAGGALGSAVINKVLPIAGNAGRQAVLDAAKRLNVPMPRFSVSTSPLVQRAGMVGQSVPGMSAPLHEAMADSTAAMGATTDTLAGGATKQTAGQSMGTGIKDWIGPVSQGDVAAKYNAVAAQMNPNTTTPLYSTTNVANQIAARRQAAGLSGAGGAVDHVTAAIQRGGLTYNGIKDLRSSVGEMMNSSVLPAGTSGAELKQIYGSLSDDLQRAAFNAGGQQGLVLHQAANDFAAQTAQRREQLVKLLGGPAAGNSDEAIYGALQRAASTGNSADIALLKQARSVVPTQNWDELSRGMVSTLGQDADGNFSPQRFLTDYGKISGNAKDELFAQNSQLRQNLDDLHTVSQQWKSLYKYANPSGTAGHGAGIGMAIEGWRHPLKTLGFYMGGVGLGKFLATPAGAGASSNFVRAVGSGNLNAIRNASSRVTGTMGAQFGAKADPMALAALATQHYQDEHEGEGAGDSGSGQPQ